ncbi:S-adenosyl-L-methionine-dependent methyltransferase [Auriculariales sp. MPI-PUGE-AT-0066]|nr:S-adenosyl-L-methionine-dependent methyltransferase [Auriculariales sp. MPI-PUGE-AT-0066]
MSSAAHQHWQEHATAWAKADIAKEYNSSGGKLMHGPINALLEQSGVVAAARRGERVKLWDNACGTGHVAGYFHDATRDILSKTWSITCTDLSAAMVDSVKKRSAEEEWHNVEVLVADAQDTNLPDGHFSHVLTSFGFGNFPSSDRALNEISRCLAPGGVIGITTWQMLGWPSVFERGLELLGISYTVPNLLVAYKQRSGYDWASTDETYQALSNHSWSDIQVKTQHSVTEFTREEIVQNVGWKNMFGGLATRMPEDHRVNIDAVFEALSLRWDEAFGEGGTAKMSMVAIIATARKPQL